MCHNVGGLVAKRAYIYSRQLDEYEDFARRLRAIVFLATPHRGPNLDEILKKIHWVTTGSKQYIGELKLELSNIQAMNDEFPNYCEDLELRSFFETRKVAVGFKTAIVVPKELAILNYRSERATYINTNHRDVCKFASQQDPNYLLIRNSLANLLAELKTTPSYLKHKETNYEQREWLKERLNIDESAEGNFSNVNALRMPGTCSWITQKESYGSWLDNLEPQICWLVARPGIGKSVLSGFVIESLRKEGLSCSFYFFKSDNQTRLGVADFLRSIAWQMSQFDSGVFDFLWKICRKHPDLDKAEFRTIWRKIFVEGIFRLNLQKPQYWVVDAICECPDGSKLVFLLLEAAETGRIHIFITSRKLYTSYIHPVPSKPIILSTNVEPDDTNADIQLFLAKQFSEDPSLGAKANLLSSLKEVILAKSSGCFLWVHLILFELRQVYTTSEVIEVLESIPSDMRKLYGHILDSMSKMPHSIRLAKAILNWTICATRPLTTEELHSALQIDLKDTINSVSGAIESTCGQLVYVDACSRVHMVHQTAREFLLGLDDESVFAINREEGNKRLAMGCLKYLHGDEMAVQRGNLSHSKLAYERSAFAGYASKSLSTHISFVSSEEDDLLEILSNFLHSPNVLSWIECIANSSDLDILIKAGKAFYDYSRNKTSGEPTFGRHVGLVEAWSIDLVRLVARFGKTLMSHSSSIYHLIPPFCPSESAIKRQFANSAQFLTVNGLGATSWGDCLSTIHFQRDKPTALARSKGILAVGLSSGNIKIYDEITYQDHYTLCQGQIIQILQFGVSRQLLASVSRESIIIWKLDSRDIFWKFELQFPCKAVSFFDNDMLLLGMLTSGRMLLWNLETAIERELATWVDGLDENCSHMSGSPSAVAIMDELASPSSCPQLIAVAYKGGEIILWDIEDEIIYDVYNQQLGSRGAQTTPCRGTATAWTLTYSHVLNPPLLAAAYSDGQLVVFNSGDGSVQAIATANAHCIVSSPDGLMLACSNSPSTILVFGFEKLMLLHRITTENHAIRSLVFSEDGNRLIDISGEYCQVWSPRKLLRNYENDEQRSKGASISTEPQEITFDDSGLSDHITDYIMVTDNEMIFCGKSNGDVCIYEFQHAHESRILFCQEYGVPIRSLLYNSEKSILISTDLACKIMVHRLRYDHSGWNIVDIILDERIGSPVEQIVLNAHCSLLLICSTQRDSLRSLENAAQEIAAISQEGEQQRKWCIHPLDSDVLILISGYTAHLYQFRWLERLTSEKGVSMLGSFSQNLVIHSIMPCFDNQIVATVFSDSPLSRSRSKILFWTAKDFTDGAISVTAVSCYQPLADDVEYLVGEYNKRIVFLDREDWICSADTQTFDVEKYHRHFFLPSNWLSKMGGPIIKVLPNGWIIVAQREELAIVRKGLDHRDNCQSEKSSRTRPSVPKGSSTLKRRIAPAIKV